MHGTGWDGTGWNGTGWDGTGRDGTGWDGMGREGTGWDGMGRDGTGWDGMGWDGMGRGLGEMKGMKGRWSGFAEWVAGSDGSGGECMRGAGGTHRMQ